MFQSIIHSLPASTVFNFRPYKLYFKQPSGTSRGILTQKKGWIIELSTSENEVKGMGECSIIEGLSPDYHSDKEYEENLTKICSDWGGYLLKEGALDAFPSIRFGLESALLDWKNGGKQLYFESDFTKGKKSIPINGLIWMGNEQFMHEQIEQKLLEGYSCLKMKVGAIEFKQEIGLLESIRKRFSSSEITLRVDANGAFKMKDALRQLKQLSELNIHSIEQPIAAGNWEEMAELCSLSPLPIALDEELIGIHHTDKKTELLNQIQPQFVILKPSLHGGLSGTKEWIEISEKLNIPWWMTSALESNIGLTTIAQFAATFDNQLPQGLGTGSLYTENFPTRLSIHDGFLHYNRNI